MPETRLYTISELAREFAVTTRTIRFYEEKGLVHSYLMARHSVGKAKAAVERIARAVTALEHGKDLSDPKVLFG